MSRWRDQLNAVGSNAFDFVQRISSELATESEIDPAHELQYHKDQAVKFERDLIKCQGELAERSKEVETLTHSVQEAYEEVEVTRQTLLNRIAAKELELEKAQHEIEKLRDSNGFSDWTEGGERDNRETALELEVVRAEKAALSEQLTALSKQVEESKQQQAAQFDSWNDQAVSTEELEELKAALNKSNDRVESLRQEMSKLIEKNHSLLNECSERQEVCQRLEQQLTTIQTRNAAVHSAEVEKMRAQVAKVEDDNRALQQQMDALLKQNEELINRQASPAPPSAAIEEAYEYLEGLARELQRTQSLVQFSLQEAAKSPEQGDSVADDKIREKLIAVQHELEEYARLQEWSQNLLELEEESTQESAFPRCYIGVSWHTSEDSFSDMNLTQQLDNANGEIERVLEEKHRAAQEAQAGAKEVERLRTELEQTKERLAAAQEKSEFEGNSQLDALYNDNERLRQEQRRLEAELERLTTDLTQSIADRNMIEELENKVREANTSIQMYNNQLREQHESFEAEREAIRRQLTEDFEARFSAAQKVIEEYEADRKKLIQHYEAEKEADKENANYFKNRLDESCLFVEQVRAENGLEGKTEENSDLKEALHQLSVDVGKKLAEVANRGSANSSELQQQLNELNATIVRLKQENEYLQGCNMSNEQRIESMRAENERLKSETAEAEEKLHELMNERKNLVEGSAEAEIYRRYTQDRIEKKQQELDEANARVQQKENEVEYYRLNFEKQQEENEQLQKKVTWISTTVKDLQSTYVECQNQLRTSEEVSSKQISDLSELVNQLQTEKETAEKNYTDVFGQLQLAENRIQDLRAEVELLENRKPVAHIPTAPADGNPAEIKFVGTTFSVPPILRQFIVSAVTCEEQQRADGALLLANLIGCTSEEKQRIADSFRPKGWGSLFRGPSPSIPQHPQNFRELRQQFVEFLERESSLQTVTPANLESNEPMVIQHELDPQPTKSSSSSTELRKILDTDETSTSTSS